MSATLVSKPAWALLKYFEALNRIGGWIAPKVDTLARKYKCHRSAVLRWIAELKRAGWIKVQRRGSTSAMFSLVPRPRSETLHLYTELPNESLSSKEKQNHRDEVARKKSKAPVPNLGASQDESELLALAGVPRKLANVAYVRGIISAGVPFRQIRAGVIVGRARAAVSGVRRIFSMKYFAGAVKEVATLPAGYIEHTEGWLKRHGLVA